MSSKHRFVNAISVCLLILGGVWFETAMATDITISSTEGGAVVDPGEGTFHYANPKISIAIKAVPSEIGVYLFHSWTGSAVDVGQVADPSSPETTVYLPYNHTLQANFVPYPEIETTEARLVGKTEALITAYVVEDSNTKCRSRFSYWEENGDTMFTSWSSDTEAGWSTSEFIEGLKPGTTYYFEAEITNDLVDISYGGGVQSFETTGLPYAGPTTSVGFDSEEEFDSLVTSNNTGDQTLVSFVEGSGPEQDGMMLLEESDETPARAKTSMGAYDSDEVTIECKYKFNTPALDVVLEVYLSDKQDLLAYNHPSMLKIGEILPPALPGRPGSYASNTFGVYRMVAVDISSLDHTQGLWMELKLVRRSSAVNRLGLQRTGTRLAAAGDGGVFIDDELIQVRCRGICMDITTDTVVTVDDYSFISVGCGRAVGSASENSPVPCMDRGFSRDGYLDAADVTSWADVMGRCALGGDCLSLCAIPLATDASTTVAMAQFMNRWLNVGMEATVSSDLLILGKEAQRFLGLDYVGYSDLIWGFDTTGTFTDYTPITADRNNTRLIQTSAADVYVLNSRTGVSTLDGQVLLSPGVATFEDKTVHVGVQGDQLNPTGRPITDVAMHNGFLYVAPVVVQSSGQSAYLAAAKIELKGTSFDIHQLFIDPLLQSAYANDQNPNLRGIREIEVDSDGNVYLLNVYAQNASDVLWKYAPDGTVVTRLFLGDGHPLISDPMGLCISGNTIYLAKGLYDPANPYQAMVYGLSTTDFSIAQTITVSEIQHVTSITADGAGSLWICGLSLEWVPKDPNPYDPPLPIPYLANVQAGSPAHVSVIAADLYGQVPDMMVPVSVLWVGE
jgi:hypothetical protein